MKFKYIIIGIVIFLIDQLTKVLMINKNITIIPDFLELNYTQNYGGAFGIGKSILITVLSILIIIIIIAFLIKEKNNIKNYIPFSLILSGSISNLCDRLFRGYVIDYIDVNIFDFPNFNVADISIVLGTFLLIIYILYCKKS